MIRCVVLAVAFCTPSMLAAQVALPDARPVPVMQVVPQPYGQLSVQREGSEIARYHFGPTLRRPFLFPLVGPSGRSLTRMGHPHDPTGHRHHYSVWVSHHDVGGVNFWADTGSGRVVHRRIEKLDDGDSAALIEMHNDWVDTASQRVVMRERRRMRFLPAADGQWLLALDLELSSPAGSVTLGKTPFGLLGVRMAKTIGVHDGGGTIRNSEGGRDEKGVFWKRARWVDYSGPITATANEGVTLMDHPANSNHPTHFHVRNDGWMGASLTFDGPRTIEAGTPLKLRYGLWIHAGVPTPEQIEAQYREFAESQ